MIVVERAVHFVLEHEDYTVEHEPPHLVVH